MERTKIINYKKIIYIIDKNLKWMKLISKKNKYKQRLLKKKAKKEVII